MHRTQSIAKRAARRSVARTWLRAAGPALVAGTSIGLAGVLADRLIGPGLTWWPFVAAPIAAGLIGATAWALWKRRGWFDAAVEVDTRLKLRDRLGTALAFERAAAKGSNTNGAADDPFIAMSLAEGEIAADGIDLKRAIPLRVGNSWTVWPAIAGATACAGLFLEPMRLLEAKPPQALITYSSDQVRAAEQAIEKAAEQVDPEASATPDKQDPALDTHREALDLLKKQLVEGRKSPDQALAGAAGVLEEEAAQIQRDAERQQAAADASRESLAGVPPEPPSGESSQSDPHAGADSTELREALRRGDPEQAAAALRELREQLQRMPAAQREKVAREMERLAGDLDKAAAQQDARAETDRDDDLKTLQDMGLNPDEARRMLDQTDAKDIEKMLRERGVDEQTAEQMAEQMARRNAEREAREQSAEQTNRLSDAAKQAAEDVRKEPQPQADRSGQSPESKPEQPKPDKPTSAQQPAPSGSNPSTPDADQERKEQQQTGDRSQGQQQGTESKPAEQRQPDQGSPSSEQKPGDQAEKKPGNQSSSQPDAKRDPSESRPSDSRESKEGTPQPKADPSQPPAPKVPQQGGSESPEQKAPDSGAGKAAKPDKEGQTPSQPQQPKPGDQPGSQKDPGNRNPQQMPAGDQSGQAGDAKSEQPGQTTEGKAQEKGGASPQQGDQPGADESKGGGMQRMEEELRQMAESAKGSQQGQQRAKELREQAQRMLEQASPEQREQMRRWAQKQQQESGSGAGSGMGIDNSPTAAGSADGFRTEDVDARKPVEPGGRERVAGEWTDPSQEIHRGGPASTRAMAETLREAQQSAEQAIEDQVVPTRYRNVREYFRKARERAEREAQQAPAPAPAAQDAEPTKK